MSFLSDFECDVFVSYATANNQSFAEGKEGWITTFRDNIKKLLDEGLEHRNASEVWMDYQLRSNEPFDEQLGEKVKKSAVMLVVLSEAYLASSWCRRELEIFLSSTYKGQTRSGCVFLVHYEPVPLENWPKQLAGLSNDKNRFFRQERDGVPSKPLGFPIPNPENPAHQTYYDRLIDLRTELAAQLAKIKEALSCPDPPIMPSAESPDPKPGVYLAEVTGDTLFDQRLSVKNYLEQAGLRVFPANAYQRDPNEYAKALDGDLAKCLMFVQMLGRFPTGYEQLQQERALSAKKEILRWRSRALVLDDVPDPAHRGLLEGADVKALDFDELKRTITDRCRVLSAKSTSVIEGDHFVLVNAAKEDDALAESMTQQLAQWGAGFDVVNGNVSLSDLVASNTYDALLVIYGQCPYDWVRQQLIKCRKILLTHKNRCPACAVYIGPPENKKPLRCRPARVTVLDTHDRDKFQGFIQKLSHSEVSP